MKLSTRRTLVMSLCGVLLGCGSGGGDGDAFTASGSASTPSDVAAFQGGGESGTGAFILTGNVDDVVTSETGTLTRALRSGSSSGVAGVLVEVVGAQGSVAGETDEQGFFEVEMAPSGDSQILFQLRDCLASVALPAVVDGAMVNFEDVVVNCGSDAAPGRVLETFEARVRETRDGQGWALKVCARIAGQWRQRVVFLPDGAVSPAFEAGTVVRVRGERRGTGAGSVVRNAGVELIDDGDGVDPCTDG